MWTTVLTNKSPKEFRAILSVYSLMIGEKCLKPTQLVIVFPFFIPQGPGRLCQSGQGPGFEGEQVRCVDDLGLLWQRGGLLPGQVAGGGAGAVHQRHVHRHAVRRLRLRGRARPQGGGEEGVKYVF